MPNEMQAGEAKLAGSPSTSLSGMGIDPHKVTTNGPTQLGDFIFISLCLFFFTFIFIIFHLFKPRKQYLN
jgi:hypothetical protein